MEFLANLKSGEPPVEFEHHISHRLDRLVHTEDASVIRQTVYEPNTFVPLLQLEQAKGHKTQAQWLISQMQDDEDQDTMRLENMPRAQRELLQEALQMVMQPGSKALQGLPISEEASQRLNESVATLKAAQEASAKAHPVTIRHYLTDHLGTPLALVDANGQHKGQITWAASYNAWGDVKEEYNPHHIQQPIRFQGQQLDPDTGLHYNRFRYYDPVLGRYITQDPIGLSGGLNKFLYPANPISWIDPLGLCSLEEKNKKCLQDIFGEDISNIEIINDEAMIERHFGPGVIGSTTRPGKIYTNVPNFWSYHEHVLHEYYHVVRQWGAEGMSIPGYLFSFNKKENEAKNFARKNLENYRECLKSQ